MLNDVFTKFYFRFSQYKQNTIKEQTHLNENISNNKFEQFETVNNSFDFKIELEKYSDLLSATLLQDLKNTENREQNNTEIMSQYQLTLPERTENEKASTKNTERDEDLKIIRNQDPIIEGQLSSQNGQHINKAYFETITKSTFLQNDNSVSKTSLKEKWYSKNTIEQLNENLSSQKSIFTNQKKKFKYNFYLSKSSISNAHPTKKLESPKFHKTDVDCCNSTKSTLTENIQSSNDSNKTNTILTFSREKPEKQSTIPLINNVSSLINLSGNP